MKSLDFEILLGSEMEEVKGGLTSGDCHCSSGAGQNVVIEQMDR